AGQVVRGYLQGIETGRVLHAGSRTFKRRKNSSTGGKASSHITDVLGKAGMPDIFVQMNRSMHALVTLLSAKASHPRKRCALPFLPLGPNVSHHAQIAGFRHVKGRF